MKPLSGLVLVVAALLTSPALAGAAAGEMAFDVALTRYLLAVGVCWVLLTVASEWFWSEPGVDLAPAKDDAADDVVPASEPEVG
ncbi:hypothetical protein EXE58_07010 [Nocardioides seonyuensis]|uniref:Peptidoglycan-binding protein n=1 Tax=Nocardioides seonyuensis TaxID=2518371 RepID=A0A4P7IDI1_9ACTN|nr:hypothetical protein [Nocardioides seonyuensis]QBX55225.1 hypothetical protein EXE58_07010 [Nocardioides seonyuensis]